MDERDLAQLSDQDLLNQIVAGSQIAFGELYDRHSKHLYNYLLRLIFEKEAAEDILQDVYLVVWQKAGSFNGASRVSTWLFSIAHHRAVDWLRSQNRLEKKLTQLAPLEIFSDAGLDVEGWADLNLQNETIWQAVEKLSPEHRAVLELAFVYEMPYGEIAQVMACPVGTVKSRMHHALKLLNRHLARKRG